MKNRGNENGRIDGRRYFIACLTRRKSSSLSLETNAPSPVHWDGSSEPRPSIHPSIHPFIYPSIILPLSSKHPKVIITPLRPNKKRRSQSSIADHHSLPASSAFNRVIYSLLVDIPFFPVFVKGISSNRKSKFQ